MKEILIESHKLVTAKIKRGIEERHKQDQETLNPDRYWR